MDDIEFVPLSEIKEEQIIDLMNYEQVGNHLPLLIGAFSKDDCKTFLKAKQKLWDEHGYGPWAFLIKGEFAGWGGFQPEHGDADFALILYPKFWGWGRKIFNKVKDHAFNQMNLNSITILLPPSRPNSKAITRLGFHEDSQLVINGALFIKFRLLKSVS
jgi:[ribosomal protein S5]-alanine N-acetyltransferase